MNTITPTSGIDLLVHKGMDRLREKATSPDAETGLASPMSGLFLQKTNSRRSKARSGDYSCLQVDLSDDDDDGGEAEGKRARLLELPNELQYMIVSHLGFGDLESLRRACRFYRNLLNPEYINRDHFGGDRRLLEWQLTSFCQSCLANPGRHSLILSPPPGTPGPNPRPRRPPSSKCFRCSVQARDLRVGTRLPLADARSAWVCRWCGWPIAAAAGPPPSWASDQFHAACYDRYYRVLWAFLCLGLAQLAAGAAAAALPLRYFRDQQLVLPPAAAAFALLWICLAFLVLRGNRVRTYRWVGVVELVILGLWMPPIYAVARMVAEGGAGAEGGAALAALVFFCLNALFRLLNCIGNVVLIYEYDMTKHYVPGQPLKRKLLNMLMAGLIYWTYPQCVEQRYPPDYL